LRRRGALVRLASRAVACGAAGLVAAAPAGAQQPAPSPARFEGTVVTLAGHAQLELPNDEASASFYAEQQDPDLARAQSTVNQRVADGVAALRRVDPKCQVESGAYESYPMYASSGAHRITGWRVRQTVFMRTGNLAQLPQAVAAAQALLALGSIDFHLSRAARERVEGDLVQRAISDANVRIAAAAQALSIPPARVRLEELDFGAAVQGPPMRPLRAAATMAPAAESVAEPSFEPGTTSEQASVTARARFLVP